MAVTLAEMCGHRNSILDVCGHRISIASEMNATA